MISVRVVAYGLLTALGAIALAGLDWLFDDRSFAVRGSNIGSAAMLVVVVVLGGVLGRWLIRIGLPGAKRPVHPDSEASDEPPDSITGSGR